MRTKKCQCGLEEKAACHDKGDRAFLHPFKPTPQAEGPKEFSDDDAWNPEWRLLRGPGTCWSIPAKDAKLEVARAEHIFKQGYKSGLAKGERALKEVEGLLDEAMALLVRVRPHIPGGLLSELDERDLRRRVHQRAEAL